MKEFKVLSPTAILGYGFPKESFMRGMQEKPDLIAVDAGSVDPGPYYLGSGKSFTDRTGVKRDLVFMLVEGVKAGIPVVIGSAGGSGALSHTEWCRDIVLEIAKENKLSFKMAMITADIDKKVIIEKIKKGDTSPLAGLPELTEDTVNKAEAVVAQMGVEPFITALKGGAQVIVAGRAYDPSCFAALPIMKGYDQALAIHMGKILECAAIAATPGSGSDAVLGILTKDSFILKALSPERKFTKLSTSAHSLYEKSDPFYLPGPGGSLDLHETQFIERADGTVEVKGTKFIPTPKYQVKLEGVEKVGFRTITIAGTRDPIMIGQIEDIIEKVKTRICNLLDNPKAGENIYFHLYGKHGVMNKLEPNKTAVPHELGIVLEVVAKSQEEANTILGLTRSTLLHYGYEGRIATAGNLAFPFSPSDFQGGAVYQFTMYHLMNIENHDLFKIIYSDVRN